MSIKVCVITPISHLEQYGSLGEMDMSLTHLVLEDEVYATYYRRQAAGGRFVILDNSAFELEQEGKGLDPDPVLDAAEIVRPTEVIATDVLFDGPATIESTANFIERMRIRGLLGKYRIMGVVQGKTEEEWMTCFESLLLMPEVNTIGLSKLSVPVSFLGEKESSGCVARSRIKCTMALSEHFGGELEFAMNSSRKLTVHLLGGDNWTPWEMRHQKQYPWVRSNDSSCAVWYGLRGHVFDNLGVIDDIVLEKPDLENNNVDTKLLLDLDDVQVAILRNVVCWHIACKD